MRTRDIVWSREILLFLLFSAVFFLTFPNSSNQAAEKAIDKQHVSCVMCLEQ